MSNSKSVKITGNLFIDYNQLKEAFLKANLSEAKEILKTSSWPKIINATNEFGKTRLHFSIINKNLPMAQLLLERKADLWIKNDCDEVAFDYVVKYNSKNMFFLFAATILINKPLYTPTPEYKEDLSNIIVSSILEKECFKENLHDFITFTSFVKKVCRYNQLDEVMKTLGWFLYQKTQESLREEKERANSLSRESSYFENSAKTLQRDLTNLKNQYEKLEKEKKECYRTIKLLEEEKDKYKKKGSGQLKRMISNNF